MDVRAVSFVPASPQNNDRQPRRMGNSHLLPDTLAHRPDGCRQRLSETSSHSVALNPGRPRMRHEYTNEAFSHAHHLAGLRTPSHGSHMRGMMGGFVYSTPTGYPIRGRLDHQNDAAVSSPPWPLTTFDGTLVPHACATPRRQFCYTMGVGMGTPQPCRIPRTRASSSNHFTASPCIPPHLCMSTGPTILAASAML